MNIERMTTQVRPRNRWEAIDLGFTMAQQWFWPLWLLWLSSALPLFIVLHIAFAEKTYWALLTFWLLKPLYEQQLLHYLSHSLFGELLPWSAIRKQYFKITLKQLLPALTWRRLSMARSFNNPVSMLEGLTGQARSKRLDVLHHNQNNTSQWLTIVGVHLEATLYLSLFALCIFMIPESWEIFDWEDFIEGENLPLEYIQNITYFVAISLFAPFYVAAGFALYLTRRTELEAWDIELNFKKLRNRQQRQHSNKVASAMIMLVFSLSTLTYPQDSQALTKEKAKSTIKEVVARDDFGKLETYTTWELIEKNDPKDDGDIEALLEKIKAFFESFSTASPAIAALLEALLWIGGGLLLIYLIMRFTSWLDWMGLPQLGEKAPRRPPPPNKLFGLEVNADSLPEDVCAEAKALLQKGQLRPAIALLYRASLIQLIHLHQLDIAESFTEGECQRLVHSERPDKEAHYFARLTRNWLLLAYAHESPDVEQLHTLCDEWPQFYSAHPAPSAGGSK